MTVCTTRRVVVTAFGSLGDLHPYLAIAPAYWSVRHGFKSRSEQRMVLGPHAMPWRR